MTPAILTVLAILLSTSVWPVFRLAYKRGATPQGTGVVLSLVGMAAGVVAARATGQPLYDPTGFFLGSLGGIAYAIGPILLILRCLVWGPAGPTVTASGLALAVPVAVSRLLPYTTGVRTALVVGLAGAAGSLALLLLAPTVRRGVPGPPRRWSIMLAVGWLFAGAAGVAQLLSGWLAPRAAAATLFAQSLVCLLVLLVAASATGSWPKGPDLAAGAVAGLVTSVVVPAAYTALGQTTGLLVYAALAAGPAAIMVVLGLVVWRERLTLWAWAGCAVGIASMVLVSLPRR